MQLLRCWYGRNFFAECNVQDVSLLIFYREGLTRLFVTVRQCRNSQWTETVFGKLFAATLPNTQGYENEIFGADKLSGVVLYRGLNTQKEAHRS